MFKKITTATILFCFLLNTIMPASAFSRETRNDVTTTLATASGYTKLIGIEHMDVTRVRQAILAELIDFQRTRKGGMPVEILTLQNTLGERKRSDNTIYHPLDTNIFYPELQRKSDGIHVMCRRHDEKHGTRTYYAVFHLFPDEGGNFLPIKVYTKKLYEKKQEMSQKDQDIIARYEQHEEYDEHVIKWAHEEHDKGNLTIVERDISKDVDEILKIANITIDDTENPIRKRKCCFVPLTKEANKRIQKYKTTVIDIRGNKIEVPTYAHSSNHAIHMFMNPSVIDLIVKNDPSNPNTKVAINCFRYHLAYEFGPMVGQRPDYPEIRKTKAPEFVFSGGSLFGYGLNEISDKFYYGITVNHATDPKSYKIVDLDTNLADRDYAMGRRSAKEMREDYQKLKEALEDIDPWIYLFPLWSSSFRFQKPIDIILKKHGIESEKVYSTINEEIKKADMALSILEQKLKDFRNLEFVRGTSNVEDRYILALSETKKDLVNNIRKILAEEVLKKEEAKLIALETQMSLDALPSMFTRPAEDASNPSLLSLATALLRAEHQPLILGIDSGGKAHRPGFVEKIKNSIKNSPLKLDITYITGDGKTELADRVTQYLSIKGEKEEPIPNVLILTTPENKKSDVFDSLSKKTNTEIIEIDRARIEVPSAGKTSVATNESQRLSPKPTTKEIVHASREISYGREKVPFPWDSPLLAHVGRDGNASLLPKLVKGTPLSPPLTPEKGKTTYDTIAKALIAALSQNAISLAKKVGIKIANPVSDYTVFTLPGLYNKGAFAKDQSRFKARFHLEQLEADNPMTIAKNIDAEIEKGTLPQNIVVQLPETMDKNDLSPLNTLADKGVRFMTIRTEGLTSVKTKEERLRFRKNVYSLLLLARNITGEDISNKTIQYQLFRIFLTSLLDENIVNRDQAVTDYINNLTSNQLQNIVNTILLWRKPEKVAAPDPEIISKTLMSA